MPRKVMDALHPFPYTSPCVSSNLAIHPLSFTASFSKLVSRSKCFLEFCELFEQINQSQGEGGGTLLCKKSETEV